MNSVKIMMSVGICFLVCGMSSVENEFIQKPKEKKFYPSCNQSIELKADIIALINSIQSSLNAIDRWLIDKQQASIADITLYVEGDKDCFLQKATKVERADGYAQDMKIKQRLDTILSLLSDITEKTRT